MLVPWTYTAKKDGIILKHAGVSVYEAGTTDAVRVFDDNDKLKDAVPQAYSDAIGQFKIQVDHDDYPSGQLFDVVIRPYGACDTRDTMTLSSVMILPDTTGFRKFHNTFFQSTGPTKAEGARQEDIWYDDSDDNHPYTFDYFVSDAGQWTSVRDGTIVAAGASANWSGIVDDDGHKPENDSDVTANHNKWSETSDDDGHRPANDSTVGGTWGTDINNRPAELTDGRITTALNSNGILVSNVVPTLAVTGIGSGLYLGSNFMGYYKSGTGWTAYIAGDGDFKFAGDANNYIEWDGSSQVISTNNNGGILILGGGDITLTTGASPGQIIFDGKSAIHGDASNTIWDGYAGDLYLGDGAGNDFADIFLNADDDVTITCADDFIVDAASAVGITAGTAGNARTITINSGVDIDMKGDVVPNADSTYDLGIQTTKQWANVWADLVNGADYGYQNGWRTLEADKYQGYPKGIAIGNKGFRVGKIKDKMPKTTKPVFVVTDDFLEFKGRRITPKQLDVLLTLNEKVERLYQKAA